ncbi:universal stress protein [Pontibacter sp. KCTC 32443]|uniref:universal stress protein n=1 Tax=Pontibacter TaxID=323449 RepID=UPI00164CEEA7|nr:MULTISPECIES: universal stress protein [Pontibacter]MBC5773356.1 universal stress protein [Pontibacter sp. KCTC 32443]
MDELKNLLVALDHTKMDEVLVCYTAFLCSLMPIEKVHFVHVRRRQEIPMEVLKNLNITENTSEPEFPIEEMEQLVRLYMSSNNKVRTDVQISDGSPIKELLKLIKEKDIDLVVCGRKLRLHGSGILPHKLVHSGKTSVVLVPEIASPELNRIVVSIDFSEYSLMTIRYILQMTKMLPELEIICLHVYEVPSGYITLGITHDLFEEQIRRFAEEKYQKLLTQIPELKERAYLKLVRKNIPEDTGEVLVLEAKRAKANLLVIGARGLSATSLFLMGSVTEKVIRYNAEIPLIIFKKKNESLGFVDALIG